MAHILSARRRNSKPPSKNLTEGDTRIRRPGMETQIETVMKAKAYRRFEGNHVMEPELPEDLEIAVFPKTQESQQVIMKALRGNLLFNNYSEEQLFTVMKALKPRVVKKDDVVIREGEQGYNFYVIREGSFQFSNGMVCGKENCFGELALLFDSPRLLSVTCISEEGKLFYLDRLAFQGILAKNRIQSEGDMVETLSKVDILSETSPEKLRDIFDKAHLQTYKKGDLVVEKGSESRFFYIILEGVVKVAGLANEHMVSTELKKYDYFGESTITQHERRADVVVVSNQATLLVLDRSLLLEINFLNKLLRMDFKVLNSIFVFNILKEESKNKIKKQIQSDTLIDRRKLELKRTLVYIIKKGKCADGNQVFKEGSFINAVHLVPSVDIRTQEFQYYIINRREFLNVFTNIHNYEEHIQNFVSDDDEEYTNLLVYLKKNKTLISKYAGKKRSIKFKRKFHKLSNFTQIRLLGQGGYGAVTLVSNKADNRLYALKAVNIEKIVDKNFEGNILNEKDVLLYCDHPFILKLHDTLKDHTNFYFVFETVMGGDLYGYLYETRACHTCGKEIQECAHNPVLPVDEVKFFMACVIEAFDYLHMNSIIYRDLKLENLMIDEGGFIKVVDFGFAKKMVTARTRTMCGTVDYMAPELLLRSGHDRAVDVWAIGVLLYELLVGYPAFSKTRSPEERDHNTIFRNITKVKYKASIPDAEAQDMVKRIFVKNPRARLGMQGGKLCSLKNHKFFSRIDWDELRERHIKPPQFVPELDDVSDTKYFGEAEDYGLIPSEESVPRSRVQSLEKKRWYKEF